LEKAEFHPTRATAEIKAAWRAMGGLLSMGIEMLLFR
jgi:hypothetical protein